jgi:hypothetical protein
VVVQRGGQAGFDCGAWFKSAKAVREPGAGSGAGLGAGRGGGNAERAEGRFPPTLQFEDLESHLARAVNHN